jgi:phage shock protein PspC (stress-responsive transcriptional regulator)
MAGDGPIGGLGVLCFFFPLVGLILYLVWKDNMPMKAKGAGKAALWGFITGIVIYILFVIIAVAAAESAYSPFDAW